MASSQEDGNESDDTHSAGPASSSRHRSQQQQQQQQTNNYQSYRQTSSSSSVASSGGSSINSTRKKQPVQCLCPNPVECRGVSAVFRVLHDPRSGFVELPPTRMERLRNDPKELKVAYALRSAYLRHLHVNDNDNNNNNNDTNNNNNINKSSLITTKDGRYYVALHHFQPTIVEDAELDPTDGRLHMVCRTIDIASAMALQMNLTEHDHAIVEQTGAEDSQQFFVMPNYSFEKVKLDAKKAFKEMKLKQHQDAQNKAKQRQLQSKAEKEQQRKAVEDANRKIKEKKAPLFPPPQPSPSPQKALASVVVPPPENFQTTPAGTTATPATAATATAAANGSLHSSTTTTSSAAAIYDQGYSKPTPSAVFIGSGIPTSPAASPRNMAKTITSNAIFIGSGIPPSSSPAATARTIVATPPPHDQPQQKDHEPNDPSTPRQGSSAGMNVIPPTAVTPQLHLLPQSSSDNNSSAATPITPELPSMTTTTTTTEAPSSHTVDTDDANRQQHQQQQQQQQDDIHEIEEIDDDEGGDDNSEQNNAYALPTAMTTNNTQHSSSMGDSVSALGGGGDDTETTTDGGGGVDGYGSDGNSSAVPVMKRRFSGTSSLGDETLTMGSLISTASTLEGLQPLKTLNNMPRPRSEALAFMSAIESKRRCWAMPELETVRVEWTCHRALIRRMVREAKQIEDLLTNSLKAMEVYAGLLDAICSDCLLDDDGNLVQAPRRRKKLADQRNATSNPNNNSNTGNTQLPTSSLLDDNTAGSGAAASLLLPMLAPIFEAMNQSKLKILENVPQLQTEVNEMKALRTEIISRSSVLAKKGANIMYNLSFTEAQIQEAWERLENFENCSVSKAKKEDHWLAEASYKNAVKQGMSLWKAQCQDLEQLCSDTISLDAQRRTRTKEILLSFLPRRRRIFLRILELVNPAANQLEEQRAGRDEIDQALELALQRFSRESLSNYKRNRSSILNRSRIFKLGVQDNSWMETPPDRNLFKSELVKNVQPLDYKAGNFKASWQLALAVCTVDGSLHLFVCDHEEMTPEDLNDPTQMTNILEESLPVESVFLADCNCTRDHEQVEVSVEGDSPLQKVLRRKIYLRFQSLQHAKDWVDTYTNQSVAT